VIIYVATNLQLEYQPTIGVDSLKNLFGSEKEIQKELHHKQMVYELGWKVMGI
jgi:hypothetical protein